MQISETVNNNKKKIKNKTKQKKKKKKKNRTNIRAFFLAGLKTCRMG